MSLHNVGIATGTQAEQFRDDEFVMLKMWLNFMQEVFWTNKHTAKVGLRCNSLCKYMQYGSLHTNITYLVYFVSFCCFEASVVALIVHGFLTCYEPTECSRMVVYYFWWIVQRETLWKHVETVILGHLWTMYWDLQRKSEFVCLELWIDHVHMGTPWNIEIFQGISLEERTKPKNPLLQRPPVVDSKRTHNQGCLNMFTSCFTSA